MKSERVKDTFQSIITAIGENQYFKLKQIPDSILHTPKGKQTLKEGFKVGDEVTATATSTRIKGTKGKVLERYKQNGYWYYVTDTMGTQRQQDLVLS